MKKESYVVVNPTIIRGGSHEINTIIILGEDAIGLEYTVCDLSEVFYLRDFSQSTPIMVGLTTKMSSPTTSYFTHPLTFDYAGY